MTCVPNRSESCTVKLVGHLTVAIGTLLVLAAVFALVWITLSSLVRLAQPPYGPVPISQTVVSVSQIK